MTRKQMQTIVGLFMDGLSILVIKYRMRPRKAGWFLDDVEEAIRLEMRRLRWDAPAKKARAK